MYRIGVDLGGTNIAVGVVTDDMKIIGRGKVKTKCPRPAAEIFDDIKVAVDMDVLPQFHKNTGHARVLADGEVFLLGKLHIVVNVVEGNLGLNHPELGKVTGRV